MTGTDCGDEEVLASQLQTHPSCGKDLVDQIQPSEVLSQMQPEHRA